MTSASIGRAGGAGAPRVSARRGTPSAPPLQYRLNVGGTLRQPLAHFFIVGGLLALASALAAPTSTTIVSAAQAGVAPLGLLWLGIEPMLTRIDHLSLVLGLVLLVGFGPRLFGAVAAFVLGHSLTLAASALGLARVDPALAEALVAASVLLLAVALARSSLGHPGLATSRPCLIAFALGLPHGLVLAGSLTNIGLANPSLASALLPFNLGVEIGLLMSLGVVWAIFGALRRAVPRPFLPVAEFARVAPPYVIGSLAAFWLFERLPPIFA